MGSFKKTFIAIIAVIFFVGIIVTPTEEQNNNINNGIVESIISENNEISNVVNQITNSSTNGGNSNNNVVSNETKNEITTNESSKNEVPSQTTVQSISLSDIPKYKGKVYVSINNNIPFFTESDLTSTSYEKYSKLDSLGRCGVAIANIGKDLMPTDERGNIGSVKPTGWHTVKYKGIDGNYLYNRCHLIGFQLSGENANEKNLITGTRYMNVEGMLPFENMVADYVKETNNHVLYRVTPMFEGNNLLASGVLIEAKSVEDNGKGIQFNVYCYNVQPGIEINYKTGDSSGPEYTGTTTQTSTSTSNKNTSTTSQSSTNKNTSTSSSNKNTSSSQTTTSKDKTSSSSTNQEKDTSGTVYVTPTGKKYHLDPDCGGKNSTATTLNKAKANGKTACKKCAE